MGDSIFPPWYETPLQKNERPDSHAWMPAANDSRGRCHESGIWEKDRLTYTAKYGFRKDFVWILFFKSWVGLFFFSFFLPPPAPSLLFIISVSVYTQPNLFMYTALIRSIPERFL